MIQFLNVNKNLKYIKMNFEIREDIAIFLKATTCGGLFIGDLNCMISKSTGIISFVESFYSYRWLRLNYIYDIGIMKFESNFDKDLVKLSSVYNVDPNEVLKSINKNPIH